MDNDNFDINNVLDKELNFMLGRNILEINDTKTILVLSGGSIKGVAQLGAMHCLRKHNLLSNIKTIAATSAGSFCGMLHCAGYQPMEVYKFIKHLKLDQCTKIDTSNIITKYGLDDGSRMIFVLAKLLKAKGFDDTITFKDFFNKTKIEFIVTGACINDKKVYYFSHKSNPQMKVLDAIRISMSIPIIFTPCTYEGKIFVDGGCIDNFPINLFDNKIRDTIIGIYVSEERQYIQDIKYIEDYLQNVLQCLYEGISYRDTQCHSKNIIQIKCSVSSNNQTALSCMFDEGFQSALKKINEWK